MSRILRQLAVVAFLVANSAVAAQAQDASMADRVLGNPNAPVKVEEFVSLTCTHCADFYVNILPDLEKNYVDSGKVKFILRDFPLDGTALKAAALARCLPSDSYYPFVKTLYGSQAAWAFTLTPDATLIQYAKLGGLSEDKAKACITDTKLQDAIIAERATTADKYKINATPSFVINDGAEIINGAQPAATFAAAFDRALTAKK